MSYTWRCPYCGQNATIDNNNEIEFVNNLYVTRSQKWKNKNNDMIFTTKIVTCPNENCKEFSLEVEMYKAFQSPIYNNFNLSREKLLKKWKLLPHSMAKVFPNYIPYNIKKDYEEACAILNDSPKASATLSRRCLQGIIRDYWKITDKNTLFNEIKELSAKGVDQNIIDTLQAFRSIANIGAHPEKNNTIIDVEKEEAEELIKMIEMLFEEWYIAREEKKRRLNNIKQINQNKRSKKTN